jgi:hypothetical protein
LPYDSMPMAFFLANDKIMLEKPYIKDMEQALIL